MIKTQVAAGFTQAALHIIVFTLENGLKINQNRQKTPTCGFWTFFSRLKEDMLWKQTDSKSNIDQ